MPSTKLLGGVRPGGGPRTDASRRVDGASARVATNVETGREFGGDIGRDEPVAVVLAPPVGDRLLGNRAADVPLSSPRRTAPRRRSDRGPPREPASALRRGHHVPKKSTNVGRSGIGSVTSPSPTSGRLDCVERHRLDRLRSVTVGLAAAELVSADRVGNAPRRDGARSAEGADSRARRGGRDASRSDHPFEIVHERFDVRTGLAGTTARRSPLIN